MKTTYHIPTEQFGFVSVEVDGSEDTPVQAITLAVESYNSAQRALKGGEGLPDKEYNAFIDRYLTGEPNHVEEYEKMSDEQKGVVQVIKRSLKRIKSKEEPPVLRDRKGEVA